MYEKVYELPWEVEVFEKLLEEKVYPQIRKGSKVKITGAVSENIKVRQKIKRKNRRQNPDVRCQGRRIPPLSVHTNRDIPGSLKRCFR